MKARYFVIFCLFVFVSCCNDPVKAIGDFLFKKHNSFSQIDITYKGEVYHLTGEEYTLTGDYIVIAPSRLWVTLYAENPMTGVRKIKGGIDVYLTTEESFSIGNDYLWGDENYTMKCGFIIYLDSEDEEGISVEPIAGHITIIEPTIETSTTLEVNAVHIDFEALDADDNVCHIEGIIQSENYKNQKKT